MSFDGQFEAWLSNRLRAIKAVALRKNSPTRQGHSRSNMTHKVYSQTGNYYQFVYNEIEEEDEEDATSIDITEPDQQPEIEISRSQRLQRLLGNDALNEMDVVDWEQGDGVDVVDEDSGLTYPSSLFDVNHNNYCVRPDSSSGVQNFGSNLLWSRAQTYSTTSLEFSDIDSDPTDTVQCPTTEADVWNFDEFRLDREPFTFVEFMSANGGSEVFRDNLGTTVDDDLRTRTESNYRNDRRYDHLVSVRYHKEELAEDVDDGDFIDDDDVLLRRYPPGSDVMMTSFGATADGLSAMSGVLPADLTEMTLDADDFAITDVKDRDPIIYMTSSNSHSVSGSGMTSCCRRRRLLIIVLGVIVLVIGFVLLVVLVYLMFRST